MALSCDQVHIQLALKFWNASMLSWRQPNTNVLIFLLGTLRTKDLHYKHADLKAEHIVVPLPGSILYIGSVQSGQARQQAVAVTPTAAPACLNAITCDPCAQRLPDSSQLLH